MNRRQLAADETRTAILSAAREIFGRAGFDAAQLADIARKSSATTGAIYHHFTSKQVLFEAVAEGVEADLLQAVLRSGAISECPWEMMEQAFRVTIREAARPGVARIIFTEAPTVIGSARWQEIEMRYGFGKLHALLEMAKARGTLVPDNVVLAAQMLLGSLMQAARWVSASPSEARISTATETALCVLRAMRTELPSAAD